MAIATKRTIPEELMTSGSDFVLGKGYISLKEHAYNPDKLNNSHIAILGKSQSGKTRTVKKLLQYLSKDHIDKNGEYRKKTGFVLDYSGDMGVDGENLITIKARKSDYGLSLFEFSKDHDSGGPNVQRDEISRMINRYFLNNTIGTVQKAVLEKLVTDCYAQKGIIDSDEATWNNELPTVNDLLELMGLIRESIETSIAMPLIKQIHKDGKKIRKLEEKIAPLEEKLDKIRPSEDDDENEKGDIKIDSLSEKIESLKGEQRALYDELSNRLKGYLDYKIWGEEDNSLHSDEFKDNTIDLAFYGERNAFNALKDLKIHIAKIVESGAFSGRTPTIIEGVNRFDLSRLSLPLQKLFTDVIAQRLFMRAKSRGKYSEFSGRVEGWKVDMYLCIDEAKTIIPEQKQAKESKEEPINVIVSQSLKFGMFMILASQKLEHFSSEQLSNVHSKLIFELGQNDYSAARNLLGAKEQDMKYLQSFGVGLMFSGSGKPSPVTLPWANI